MSLFRSVGQSTAVTPDYTGLQIQTAVNALPVPIVCRAVRGNFMHSRTPVDGGRFSAWGCWH